VSATVAKGPAMPAPDSVATDATDADKPWSKPDQGENKKFDHPDKLLALVGAFQALEVAMSLEFTYKGADGNDTTTLVGAALAAIL